MYWEFWTAFWKHYAQTSGGAFLPSESDQPPAEQYRYMTEYGTQILAIFHSEEGCRFLSSNFAAITGYPCEECTGEAFFALVHDDFRQALRDMLAAKAPEPQAFRCKLQHAGGAWQWYRVSFHPQPSGEQVCIIENIHKAVLTQNTLQKARIEAELALRARSEFLSNMSHELRTPLNAVIGFSQIIESGLYGKIDNPHYMEYIKHIQASGYDLLLKVEDLLEIADIEAGRVTLAREEIYASDILEHIAEAQAHRAAAAKVTLEIAPVPSDMLLHVDRLKLQHILGHLVANALRFTQEGGRIRLSAAVSGQGELEIVIADDGAGMSEAKRDAICAALEEERCWTANHDRTIGLGLALAREFASLHDGRLALESGEGKGTEVRISLPRDCVRSAQRADYLQAVS